VMHAATIAIAMAGLGVAVAERRLASDLSDWSDWILANSRSRAVAPETRRNRSNEVLATEHALEATYRALPKNQHGLLPRNASAYLVQRYIMQVHQYSIRGLGSDPLATDSDANNQTGADLLAKAPEALGTFFESRQGGRGLTLHDTAKLVLMLHQLVMDHTVEVMDQVYENLALLGMLPKQEEGISIKNLVKVVWAWQWLQTHDVETEADDLVSQMHQPTQVMVTYGRLVENLARTKFYQERNHRNPFKPNMLSVADVVQLVQQTAERMGEWQDYDCKVMKKQLIGLDPEGDGRVPLDVLYDKSTSTDENGEQILAFSEDETYLRSIGALDESIPKHPQVLISNYILGPANCFGSPALQALCCLNECNIVLNQIEGAVKGSSARPDVLAPLLANLAMPSVDQTQPFSEVLMEKLSAIAEQNHGRVPLHGRLFTQWLHFAFPQECPYPHVTQKDETGKVLATSFFQSTARDMVGWTDDEILPLVDVEPSVLLVRNLLCAVFMVLALLAMSNQVWIMARSHMRSVKKDVMGIDLKK